MRIKLLRYIMALFLCGTTTMNYAQEEVLFEEHFDGITNVAMGSYIHSLENWNSFKNCSRSLNVIQSNPALKIERNTSKDPEGYATIDALGYIGDAILSFSHGYTSGTSPTQAHVILSGNAFINKNGQNNGQNSILVDVKTRNNSKMTTECLYIGNLEASTTITFMSTSSIYYAIDNILIVKDILSENINNNSFIAVHKGNDTTVKTSRTLKGGIWNTLCLPFDVTKATMEAALGENQDIKMRTYSSYDAGNKIMYFEAVADDATITAGTPFLIKINNNVENPTFSGVTIIDTLAKAIGGDGSVKFVGTYSPIDLNTNGTHLFITTTGTVAKPLDDSHNHLKGLRAYIDLTDCPSPVRLNIDGETTDIQQVAIDEERPNALYNLKGQRLQSPKKGIIIKDGKLSFIK